MASKSATASKLKAIIKALIVIELVYLVVVNALLSAPLTQNVVNSIKPDKFKVSWERAWSWYPVRVHATGVSANGQSRSQQWELHTPSLSAPCDTVRREMWRPPMAARRARVFWCGHHSLVCGGGMCVQAMPH